MVTELASLTCKCPGRTIRYEGIKHSSISVWHQKKDKCLPDYAIGSLAELFGNIITFIHDEVLVEDLEGLAALEISHVVAATIVYCLKCRSDQDILALRRTIGEKLPNQSYGVRLV